MSLKILGTTGKYVDNVTVKYVLTNLYTFFLYIRKSHFKKVRIFNKIEKITKLLQSTCIMLHGYKGHPHVYFIC